jgi:hypothetical protein
VTSSNGEPQMSWDEPTRDVANDLRMGVSGNLLGGEWTWPIHGLRHPTEGDTTGWFVWSGEWSDDDDFFVPIHQHHLLDRIPELREYLALRPGSRFLVTPDYVDTWEDSALLDT